MKFLPYENIHYVTSLQTDDLINRLEIITEKTKNPYPNYILCKYKFKTNTYIGELDGLTFSMRRNINYRNSFLPLINGTIYTNESQTSIQVTMRLSLLVIVFMTIWCGGCLFACYPIVFSLFTNEDFKSFQLIPLFMTLFGYLLTLGGFKYESIMTKKDLKKLFEANVIEDNCSQKTKEE